MFLLLLFFIKNHFRGSFKKYVEKYCKAAPRSTSLYHKVDQLLSYFHVCHDEITYFNRGFFQYSYHDMVESSVRGKFWLFFFMTKLCNIYYKVDIE